MKKALLLIATLMLALSCVFACSKKPEAHKHTLTHHDAVAATCIATGSVAYDECSGCHKKFDAEGNEIEDVTVAINPANHTELAEHTAAPASCIATGTIYYKECNGCHKKYDAEGNEITNIVDPVNPTAHRHLTEHAAVAATCIAAGNVYYKECDDCHKKYDKDGVEITDVVIAIKQHSLTSVPAKESTCTVQGNKAYNHCSVCEKDFDDDGNELESVKLPLKEHTLGDWESDENGHYKVCSVCTGKFEEEGHTLGASVTVDYQNGDHYYTCTVCNYQKHEAHNWSAWTKKDDSDHTRNCTVCQRRENGAHEEGTAATCKDPAVCKLCNGSYGPVSEEHHLDSNGTCTVCGRNRAVWNKSYSGVTVDMYGKVNVSKNAVFTFGADGNSAGAKGAVVGKENGSIEEEEDWYEETITRYLISNAIMYVKYDDKAIGKVALVYAYDRAEETYYNSNKWKTPTHTEKTMTGYIDAATGIIFLDDNHKYTATVLIPSDTPFTADKFEGGAFNTRDYYGVAFYKFTVGDKSVTVYYGAETGFGGVLFNATVTDFEGNSVAIADFATAPAMIVKDKDGNVIKSFGYNGTTVVELDSYAGKYTGTFGEVLIDGLGNITVTVDGEEQKGTYVAVDFTDHNFEIFFYGEDGKTVVDYYEILADLSAYTYTGKQPKITITFDLGDYGDNFTGEVGKKVAYTLPGAPAPTDESYIFKGWLYTTDADDVTYQPGDVVAFTSDVTLIANWQRKTAITVDLGDGNTVIVYAGEDEILKDVLAAKVTLPDGKTLKHWAYAGNPIDGEAVVGTDAITITAVYKAQYTLTVVYGNGLENKTYTLLEDEVTAPEEPAYTNGKNFDHWYTSDDEGVTEAEVFEVGSVLTKDTTIYAAWVASSPFTGTWYGAYISVKDSNYDQVTGLYGDTRYYYVVDADGVITDSNSYTQKNKTVTLEDGTNKITVGTDTGYYFPEYKAVALYKYSSSGARTSLNLYFIGATAVPPTSTNRNGYSYQNGKYIFFIINVTRNGETKQVSVFADGDNFYFDVVVDKATISGGTTTWTEQTSYASLGTNGLKVYNSDRSVLIASFKKPSGKWTLYKEDGLDGDYIATVAGVADQSITLDGVGGLTYGGKTGTYELASDGTYDVYLDSKKEYYSATIDKDTKTMTLTKVMVTIAFELNTVDGVDMGAYDSISVNKNVSISLSTLTKPEKEGYVFKGWYSDSVFSSSVTTVTPVDNMTVYAKWAKACTVSFETEYGEAPESFGKEQDQWVHASDRPTLEDTEDYAFYGWYVKGDETKTLVTSSYKVTDDTVFVALWKAKVILTIKYENPDIADKTVKVAVERNISLAQYNPTAEEMGDYVFRYFYNEADENKAEISSIKLTEGENATIVAKMEHTVTLTVVSGITGVDDKSVKVGPNDEIDFSAVSFGYYKAEGWAKGKIVSGLYTDAACSNGNEFTATSITEDTTVYAKWIEVEPYAIEEAYYSKAGDVKGKGEPFYKTLKTFVYDADQGCWVSDNKAVDSSMASLKIYAYETITVSFKWSGGGENNYDIMSISVNGTLVEKASDASLTPTQHEYSVTLKYGEYIEFVYVKDGSGNKGDDSGKIYDLTINGQIKTSWVVEESNANEFAGLTFSGTYTGRADNASHNVQFVFDDASDVTGTLIVNDTIKAKFTATFANGELVMTVTENVSGAEDFVGKTLTATLSGKTFSIITCAFGGETYSLANAGTLTCAEYNA